MNQFNYEVCEKDLKKCIERAERFGMMVDPTDLVEGHKYLNNVLCKSCNKIAFTKSIKQFSLAMTNQFSDDHDISYPENRLTQPKKPLTQIKKLSTSQTKSCQNALHRNMTV